MDYKPYVQPAPVPGWRTAASLWAVVGGGVSAGLLLSLLVWHRSHTAVVARQARHDAAPSATNMTRGRASTAPSSKAAGDPVQHNGPPARLTEGSNSLGAPPSPGSDTPRVRNWSFYTLLSDPPGSRQAPLREEPAGLQDTVRTAPPRVSPSPPAVVATSAATIAQRTRNGAHTGEQPGGERVYLQIGIFRQKAEADRLRQRLEAHALRAAIQTLRQDGEKFYRVRIGPLPRAHRLKAEARLRNNGFVYQVLPSAQ